MFLNMLKIILNVPVTKFLAEGQGDSNALIFVPLIHKEHILTDIKALCVQWGFALFIL